MIPSDPRFNAIEDAFQPDLDALDEPLPVTLAVLCAIGLLLLAWISVVVLA